MAVPPASANELVQLIRKSELIENKQLDNFLAQNPSAPNPIDMAKKLVEKQLVTPFQADQLLQGRTRGFDLGNYRVRKPLGGGTTGMVFLCENRLLKKLVAVKVLSSSLIQQDGKTLQRFRREARAASLLEHPNIIRTIDIDEDDGRHFLVMEYIEGCSLDELRKTKPTLPIADVVNYGIQALRGMQHVADAGLVHRDIKPGNLLLDKQGTIKILDLGLARFTDDRNDNLTVQQGVDILGTVDFMAPEQALNGSTVDHRADIYSLGATLYFLLTGKTPLPEGPTTSKIIAAQFHAPTRMSQLRPEIDNVLEDVIGKMMAKKVTSRYQQPKEAMAALVAWQKAVERKNVPSEAAPAPVGSKPKMPSAPSIRLSAPSINLSASAPSIRQSGVVAPPAIPRPPLPRPAPIVEEILEAQEVDEFDDMTPGVADHESYPSNVATSNPPAAGKGKWHIVIVVALGVTLGILGLVLK